MMVPWYNTDDIVTAYNKTILSHTKTGYAGPCLRGLPEIAMDDGIVVQRVFWCLQENAPKIWIHCEIDHQIKLAHSVGFLPLPGCSLEQLTYCLAYFVYHIFEDLGVKTFVAEAYGEPQRRRLDWYMRRLGGKKEGVLRKRMATPDGTVVDLHTYSLTREEYLERGQLVLHGFLCQIESQPQRGRTSFKIVK